MTVLRGFVEPSNGVVDNPPATGVVDNPPATGVVDNPPATGVVAVVDAKKSDVRSCIPPSVDVVVGCPVETDSGETEVLGVDKSIPPIDDDDVKSEELCWSVKDTVSLRIPTVAVASEASDVVANDDDIDD